MFLSVEEVGDNLKKKHNDVLYLIRENKITAVKFGNVWRIAQGDLENHKQGFSASDDCIKIVISNLEPLLTLKDLVDLFRVDPKTITNLINHKIIPAKILEKTWTFTREDILNYCLKRTQLWVYL